MKKRFLKKIAALISAVCVSVAVTGTIGIGDIYKADAVTYYYGDANSDEIVDEKDVDLLQKYLVRSVSEIPLLFTCDIDGNGVVNVFDLLHIKRYLSDSSNSGGSGLTDEQLQAYANEVLELVNKERAKVNVAPLELNDTWSEIAMIRAEEIVELFSHTRPNGQSYSSLLEEYEGLTVGENIAAGTSTASATVAEWVNSPGHYENIIDPEFTQIGLGVVYVPDSYYGYYWVQIFTSTYDGDMQPTEQPTESPTEQPTEAETTTVTAAVTTKATTTEQNSDDKALAYAKEVVELVNEERTAAGVEPVEFNEDLFEAAMIRAEEITELFSHTRPDGTKWSDLLKEIGYGNRWCAENIAAGRSTPEGVVEQWMNSDGHRENILGENYTQLGVGFIYDPDSEYGYYWVQMFTS